MLARDLGHGKCRLWVVERVQPLHRPQIVEKSSLGDQGLSIEDGSVRRDHFD
jgi:hypothetical protein